MKRRTILLTMAITFVLTACAWGHPGGNAARNAANAYEPFLTVDNVDELELAWQATRGGSEPIITDKYIYTLSNDFIYAYAAAGPASPEGPSRCIGTQPYCTAVWFAHVDHPSAGLALSGGRLFTVGYVAGVQSLLVFDADPASCPATENGCEPLRTVALPQGAVSGASMAVADGRVYLGLWTQTFPGNPVVVAYDERGVTNCTPGPPQTCQPLFQADSGSVTVGTLPYLAVAAGRLFVPPGGRVFDAAGTTACANGVCSPLYRLTTTANMSAFGTTVFAAEGNVLKAFDATGTIGCSGIVRTCQPMWTGALSGTAAVGQPPTVSNGKVLVRLDGPTIESPAVEAFDAAGVEGCSGSPVVCQPLWGVNRADVTGAPGVLSATQSLFFIVGGSLQGFDLAGTRSCGGVPKRCTALSSVEAIGGSFSTLPAVAFGRVAISDGGGLKVFARPG